MKPGPLCLRFLLGGERYALDARAVLEVLPLLPIKALPEAPPWVLGVLQRRGRLVPVLDLGLRAFGQAAARRAGTRLVLVAWSPPRGEARPLALMLEQVTGTLRLSGNGQAAPAGAPYAGAVWQDGARLVQKIELAGLLPAALADQLFPAEELPA